MQYTCRQNNPTKDNSAFYTSTILNAETYTSTILNAETYTSTILNARTKDVKSNPPVAKQNTPP